MNFCASSVEVTNNGMTVMGNTPKFPVIGLEPLIIYAEPNKTTDNSSSSGFISCPKMIDNVLKLKQAFIFEK